MRGVGSVVLRVPMEIMSRAYHWAFVNPWRKMFHNVALTGVSVAVALLIGTIEWLQLLISLLHWNCGWCELVLE